MAAAHRLLRGSRSNLRSVFVCIRSTSFSRLIRRVCEFCAPPPPPDALPPSLRTQEIKGSTAALEKAIAKNHSDLNDRLAKLEK